MARVPAGWRPLFCPNPDCDSPRDSLGWRFKKKGHFRRACDPRPVQRYLCQHCRRSFSSQTFSLTYWLKRPELLQPIFRRVLACSAYRQIAPELNVCHTTVQRQVERLGRHCLLLHETLRSHVAPTEPLVLDGVRAFESGHTWPFDLNMLVGVSHFIYGFNEAELRRSGRMTSAQARQRNRLEVRFGRPHPQATRIAVEELVGRIVPEGARAEIRSDRHQAYPLALKRLLGRRIRHATTSAQVPRTTGNPLFPANLADLLLRHTGANHKRQTIAFSKRRQAALYRAALFAVWRNYLKPTSERRRDAPPGVRLGMIPRRLRVEEILERRLFPWRLPLGDWLTACYYARIPTRCLPVCREHRRRFVT